MVVFVSAKLAKAFCVKRAKALVAVAIAKLRVLVAVVVFVSAKLAKAFCVKRAKALVAI